MQVIEFAGISFDEKRIELLQTWLTPDTDIDSPQIENDVNTLERVQSFLIKNWDSLSKKEDNEVKRLLTSLQYIKERMFSISHVEKGADA
jgi:hypothetical protein